MKAALHECSAIQRLIRYSQNYLKDYLVFYFAVQDELSIVLSQDCFLVRSMYKVSYPLYWSQDCFLLRRKGWAIHCTITGLFPTMLYKVSYPLYYHRIVSLYDAQDELSIVLLQDCFLLCCTRWAIHCTITGLFPTMLYKVSYPLYYHRIVSYYAVQGELSIVLSQDCFQLCCTRWAIHCIITGLFPTMLYKVSYPLYYHRIVS